MEAEYFERHAARRRLRFRIIVGGLSLALLLAIFTPWALVSSRVISSDTAEAASVVAALVLLGAWRALLAKIADPNDAPEPSEESRRAHLRGLLITGGAIAATLLVLAAGSFIAGIIGTEGLTWTGILAVLLGSGLGWALMARGAHQSRLI